jgi:hypothetical protein
MTHCYLLFYELKVTLGGRIQMEGFWVKTHANKPQKVLNVKNYHKTIRDLVFFFLPFETILIMESFLL